MVILLLVTSCSKPKNSPMGNSEFASKDAGKNTSSKNNTSSAPVNEGSADGSYVTDGSVDINDPEAKVVYTDEEKDIAIVILPHSDEDDLPPSDYVSDVSSAPQNPELGEDSSGIGRLVIKQGDKTYIGPETVMNVRIVKDVPFDGDPENDNDPIKAEFFILCNVGPQFDRIRIYGFVSITNILQMRPMLRRCDIRLAPDTADSFNIYLTPAEYEDYAISKVTGDEILVGSGRYQLESGQYIFVFSEAADLPADIKARIGDLGI